MPSKLLRDYGIAIGQLPPGPKNHIVDVTGVRVGHVTLDPDNGYPVGVCTGVTAVLPHTGNWFRKKVTAVTHVINGFGKTTGTIQVEELGYLESPILLTNTFGVPAATEGGLRYLMNIDSLIGDTTTANVVVGECNDGYLNDIRGLHVRPAHAVAAIQKALDTNDVSQGSLGAGRGMRCFGWKGGVGSASREISQPAESGETRRHIGALVVSNFGSSQDLTIKGYPVGKWIQPDHNSKPLPNYQNGPTKSGSKTDSEYQEDGSIMIVLATDIPLSTVGLRQLAKRAVLGLAHVGSIVAHGSGDIVIAFSTAEPVGGHEDLRMVNPYDIYGERNGKFMTTCFRAVIEVVEESVLNSLCMATTTVGRGERILYRFPMETIVDRLW